MLPIILASSSPYRKALLAKLELPFTCISPNIDETPQTKEHPKQLASRLAREKALAVASTHHNHLIIASDQVAAVQGKLLGKPGNIENATTQLQLCSANTVTFYTSITLLNTATDRLQLAVEPYTVTFRPLTATSIKSYLQKEQPFDCAGSFKMEGLGISLFEKLQGDDPNILIGLPLIQLVNMLHNEGIAIP